MQPISPRIILVRPSHPGNIGAVARAMKTMALSELFLVSPVKPIDDEAIAMSTHAKEILEKAVIVDNIADALKGIQKVYATSANVRGIELPSVSPREAAKQIKDTHSMGTTNCAGILFGPENHGLSNEDLGYAHALIKIPTSSAYHSLNLAAAVQVIAYECFVSAKENISDKIIDESSRESSDLIDMSEMHFFYAHLESLLIKIKYLDVENPRQLMPKLKRLFNRAHLKENEIKILHGILKAIEVAVDASADRFI